MICPACKQNIDDDSFYCDQCGSELSICPRCEGILTMDICPLHGLQTIKRKLHNKIRENNSEGLIDRNSEYKYELQNSLINLTLSLSGSEIIGRKEGVFRTQLSGYKQISGRHAKVFIENDKLFIMDLGSTNKTRINGEIIASGERIEVKPGDRVTFADIEFILI